MIYKIYAENDEDKFKEVEFKKDLNIIVGIKEDNSGKKDNRNGVGKTTLIEVLDFCLGTEPNKKSYLKNIKLIEDWIFKMDLDLFDQKITISRAINESNKIFINGTTEKFPITPKTDKTGATYYTIKEWQKLLGLYLFKLDDINHISYTPTYRNLISYFIRKNPDAYLDPFLTDKYYKEWKVQVYNSFLLGLNSCCATKINNIKIKNSELDKELKKIKSEYPSKGQMEAEKLNLEAELEQKDKLLSKYQIHEEYEHLEDQADSLSREIRNVSNKSLTLKKKLSNYKSAIKQEKGPEEEDIENLFEEVGIVFSNNIKKTFKEAKKFHEKLISNRKEFLNVEILELEKEIKNNANKLESIDLKRSDIMQILNTHKAFDEVKYIQKELYDYKLEIDKLNFNINKYNLIDENKDKLKEDSVILSEKMKREYELRRPVWEKAVNIFNSNTMALYKEQGKLIINTPEKGYDFKIEFPKDKSRGYSKMKIFCYDAMLLELNSEKRNIDFLIHDSELYDGVDSTQVALALQYIRSKCINNDTQYICTLNSDTIPDNYWEDNFDIKDFIRLELSDKDPSGHIFSEIFN
ncbi:DUF2326 domain-containing protein [Methanobrevibacter sp. DSM 116169]|uniref:DUF2326 domain-containing protein n=1 Tax=Methanobrevibacter sp. DSM 116169 TaxID=3242727 RepID=UPI0038FC1F7D